jgi:hypothetical protein
MLTPGAIEGKGCPERHRSVGRSRGGGRTQAIECYGVIRDMRTAALVAPATDARPPCRSARRSRPPGERLPVAQNVERLVDVADEVP